MASRRRLTAWRKLKLGKGRVESGCILLEGIRLVEEGIKCFAPHEAILIADNDAGHAAADRISEMDEYEELLMPQIYRVPPAEFRQLTSTVHTSGIASIVRWSPSNAVWSLESGQSRRALYCDHLSDPGNLGTLIRTAAGLGLDAVYVSPESVDVTNPKVVRSTAGALFHIPIAAPVTVERIARWADSRGIPILLADAGGAGLPLAASDRWLLVIGGETHGLSTDWNNFACQRVGVSMSHSVESLNAAVAGAILMDRLMNRPPAGGGPDRCN